jgi:hypothetical protein
MQRMPRAQYRVNTEDEILVKDLKKLVGEKNIAIKQL